MRVAQPSKVLLPLFYSPYHFIPYFCGAVLSLVINAIVVWNTRHFARAQAKLLEQGEQVDDMVWQHLSPLAWKHINLVGSYHFSEVQLEEEFRPLRESESKRERRERRNTLSLSPAPVSGRSDKEENGKKEEEALVQLSLLQEQEDE